MGKGRKNRSEGKERRGGQGKDERAAPSSTKS